MSPRRLAICLLLTPIIGFPHDTQVTLTAPGPQTPGARGSEASYGPPRVADIETINFAIDGYQRTQVLTEGQIDVLVSGQYWTLHQGSSSLLLLVGHGLNTDALERGTGSGARMEVRGVVRLLRPKEYLKGVDLDLIEDPTLPPLPAPAFGQGWPRISITALAIRERVGAGATARESKSIGLGRQILDEPSAFFGKTARIYGQFRGRNLFADLPANSARAPNDWVLKDGDTAMWVLGKAPKGEGWKLDLDYKGDTKNWLEVEGKPEVVNGIVYLKASHVMMSKAPVAVKATPPPR